MRPVLEQLLSRFRGPAGGRLLAKRGPLLLRTLCVQLDARDVYSQLAGILETERDVAFATAMVQALSLILLTAQEVSVGSARHDVQCLAPAIYSAGMFDVWNLHVTTAATLSAMCVC